LARNVLAGALALAALDRVKEAGTAMASPTYGLDTLTLAFAVLLAAAIVMIGYLLMPQVADLMMPPPLSGAQ
jgi:hypothetical protein